MCWFRNSGGAVSHLSVNLEAIGTCKRRSSSQPRSNLKCLQRVPRAAP